MLNHFTPALRLVTIFLLSTITSFAQSTIKIDGLVIDNTTSQPISFANVIIKGSLYGAVTDEDGNFSMVIKAYPDTLIVSHIGYKTTEVIVKNNTLRIELPSNSYFLSPVSVEKKSLHSIDRIQNDQRYTAIDYEFYDEYILLLAFKKKRKQSNLFLLDVNGNVVLEKELPLSADSLYKDCLGNIHLLTSDSAYQLYYDYRQLRLLHAVNNKQFIATMTPCKGNLSQSLITSYDSFKGLKTTYYYANNGQSNLFYESSAQQKVAYIERKFDLYYYLRLRNSTNRDLMAHNGEDPMIRNNNFIRQFNDWNNCGEESFGAVTCPLLKNYDTRNNLGPNSFGLNTSVNTLGGYMTSVDGIRDNLNSLRQQQNLDWLDQKMTAPIANQVIVIDSNLYILNYEQSMAHQFNDHFRIVKSIPLQFNEKNESNKIFVDELTNEIYTVVQVRSNHFLVHLDKQSFTEIARFPFKGKLFPNNIRIRGNKAYFLYNSPIEKVRNALYSMQL